MNKTLFFIVCLFWLITSKGQSQPGVYKFEQEDVKPGRIMAERQFSDSALWGILNGGGDLYQEYGIKQLIHQNILFNGALFKADIYEMTDSAAAFGIYSISILNCQMQDPDFSFACLNPLQVQFCSGRYYVSISNIRGDSACLLNGISLAKKLYTKIPQPQFSVPSIFRTKLLIDYVDKVKVIYGPLGLQNGYPDWSEWFENMQNYYITMLPVSDSTGSLVFARIFFGKPGEMDVFRKRTGLINEINPVFWKQNLGNRTLELIRLDDVSCLFLETRDNNSLAPHLQDSFEQVGKAGSQDTDTGKPR